MIDKIEEHIGFSATLEYPVALGDSLLVTSEYPQKVLNVDLGLRVVNNAALADIGAINFIK